MFYLGRPYDLGTKASAPGLLLYDAKDLVTHAVCIGMTSSSRSPSCAPRAVQMQLADLDAGFKAELAALEGKANPLTDPLETIAIRPKRTHVSVTLCALVWAPHWQGAQGGTTPAWA